MRSSPVCLDASVIVPLVVPSPLSDSAAALLAGWIDGQVRLIAPPLAAYEVTSTLRRLVHLQELTAAEGENSFRHFRRLPIDYLYHPATLARAWELAKELGRPRAYDTAYLALAERYGCVFWTADERLFSAVSDRLDWVHCLRLGQP